MSPRPRRAGKAPKKPGGAAAKPRKPKTSRKGAAAPSTPRQARSKGAAAAKPSIDGALRRQAERMLRRGRKRLRARAGDQASSLILELEVHQVELELQNEELRRAQAELATAHDLYVDLYDFAPVGYVTLDGAGTIRQSNLMAGKVLGVERRRLIGNELKSFLLVESKYDWQRYLHEAQEAHGPVAAEFAVPTNRIVRIESTLLHDRSEFRCALLDVTQRRRAEQELEGINRTLERRVTERTASLEASNRELQAHIDENKRINNALIEQRLRLRTILESAAEGILTTDGRGAIETANPAAERIFGYSSGDMIGLDLRTAIPGLWPEREIAAGAPTRPTLPVGRWRDLRCLRRDRRPCFVDLSLSLYDEEEGKLTAIVRDVSERRSLQREIAQRVTQEQQAIGRNIHDGVAQHLAAAEMMIGVLQRRLDEAATPGVEIAADLLRVVRDAQSQVRALMRGVFPYTVQSAGLEAALRELAETVTQRHGIDCAFEPQGEVELRDSHVATQLYYIASEAVHNVVRHAAAKRAIISLQRNGDGMVLTVLDDGIGIPPDLKKPSAGLSIMRHRASLIDADVTVGRGPQGGTIVSCNLHNSGGGGEPNRRVRRRS